MEPVQSKYDKLLVKVCGMIQYCNLFGVAIGYTIAASISMMGVRRAGCIHEKGDYNPRGASRMLYMMMFGVIEILLTQIADFDQISWLSMAYVVMSSAYSTIGLFLGDFGISENKRIGKIWRSFQALGAIAFAYSYSLILVEIQVTIKSSPTEGKNLSNSTFISVVATTIVYMLGGCFSYPKFGGMSLGTFFTDFGLYNLGNLLISFGFYSLRNLIMGLGFYNPKSVANNFSLYKCGLVGLLFVTRYAISIILEGW